MRRPNRSIEVLDISLMAVVTKAMGAFLVLMVVFMQYYSSQPLGQQTAQQITQQVEQTQRDLTEVLRKVIAKATPEDIAKLLEEMRRRLEEAKKLIEQLRRDNDALNAQVQRLEQENAALEQEIAELEKKLANEKFVVTGHLINWDCMDARLRIGLVVPEMYLNRPNNVQDKYVLNDGATLGQGTSLSDHEFRRTYPNVNATPGTHARFNNSSFYYVTDPGVFNIVVVKQSYDTEQLGQYRGLRLKRTQQDCSVYITMQTAFLSKNVVRSTFTIRIVIPKDEFAAVPYQINIQPSGEFDFKEPSPPILAWLKDQVANAAKVSP
ncbi:MAG: hypothetical protein K2P86_05040 [Xanthobacteraceae bacterium]|nr:hypothetical protein [Xanthobacteraceae bacterium]